MHNRILRFLILTAWMSLLIGCRPASDLTATATPTGASEFGPAASSTAALSGSWQTASQVVNEPYQGTFSFAYPAGWGFRSTFSTAIEFALASDPALITVGRIEAAAAHQPVPLSGDEVFIGIYLIPGSPVTDRYDDGLTLDVLNQLLDTLPADARAPFGEVQGWILDNRNAEIIASPDRLLIAIEAGDGFAILSVFTAPGEAADFRPVAESMAVSIVMDSLDTPTPIPTITPTPAPAVLLTGTPGPTPTHALPAAAPYLYYYSADDNAWIVERADGSDRHLLGAGLSPAGTNAPQEPGWSPSGEWFGWISRQVGGPLGDDPDPDPLPLSVVRVDGTRAALPLPQGRIQAAVWSPTEDLLATVHGQEYDPVTYYYTRTVVSLFDVAGGRLVGQATLPGDITYPFTLHWSPTGEAAAFHLVVGGTQTAVVVIQADGSISTLEWTRPFVNPGPAGPGPLWSDTGWLVVEMKFPNYPDDMYEVGLYHPISGEQRRVYPLTRATCWHWRPGTEEALACDPEGQVWHVRDTEPGPVGAGSPVAWSPDSRYALVFADGQYVLLDTTDAAILPLETLPPDLGFKWWAGDEMLFVKDEVFYTYLLVADYLYEELRLPSPGGVGLVALSQDRRYLAYSSAATDYAVSIFDRATGQIAAVEPLLNFDMPGGTARVEWRDNWLLTVDHTDSESGIVSVGVVRADNQLRRTWLGICFVGGLCGGWLPPQVDVTRLP